MRCEFPRAFLDLSELFKMRRVKSLDFSLLFSLSFSSFLFFFLTIIKKYKAQQSKIKMINKTLSLLSFSLFSFFSFSSPPFFFLLFFSLSYFLSLFSIFLFLFPSPSLLFPLLGQTVFNFISCLPITNFTSTQ